MEESTAKAIHRVIERLEAIHQSSTPWTVREQLKAFIDKLKVASDYKGAPKE